MAKPSRSPLLGYNHNISHLGRVFHVQSEDSGPTTPRLFTHLFFEGTILVSRKSEYDAILSDDKVRGLMQQQHKIVMKDLMQGRLDHRIIAFFAARGEDLVPIQQAMAAAAQAVAQVAARAAAQAVMQAAMQADARAGVHAGMPGALPTSPLRETPEPVMVLPDVAGVARGAAPPVGAAGSGDAAGSPPTGSAGPAYAGSTEGIPVHVAHRRTAAYQRAPPDTPPATGPAAELTRPPFVRSGSPPFARMSSTDGVVVQRNLIIGAGSGSPARPARIRPPIPYVVTGGGHTERPPQPVPSPLVPLLASATTAPLTAPVPSSSLAPVSAVEAQRTTGAFGVPIGDDKSLDEVILEYLSEDGD